MSDAPDTVVLRLGDEETRLTQLGLYELRDDRGAVPSSQERLQGKLRDITDVLQERGYVQAAEAALVAEKPSGSGVYRRAIKGDTVPVRLHADDIALAIRGLNAFVERDDPTKLDGQVIDPEDRVRAVLKVYETAASLLESRQSLVAAEQRLLDC